MVPARRVIENRAESSSDLRTVVRVSWRHKKLLALGVLVGLGIAAALAAYLAPVYQSTALVLVVKKRPDAVAGMDGRQFSGEEYVAPAQELFKSALVIERAIQLKNLRALPSLAEPDQELTETLRKGLIVTPIKAQSGPTNVFKLAFRGAAPEDCPVVLAAILDSYKDFLDKKYQTVSTDTLELILREKETLQRDLAAKETEYRQFRERFPLVGKTKDGQDVRQERLNTIQGKRSALLLQRVEVEGQLAAVVAAQKQGQNREAILSMLVEFAAKGEPGEAGRTRYAALQEQVLALMMEERKLLETHGAKHPEVTAIRRRIEAGRQWLVLPPAAWAAQEDKNGIRVVAYDAATTATEPVELHVQLLKQKCQHIKLSEEILAQAFEAEHDEAGRLAKLEIQEESFRTNIALGKQLVETLVRRLGEVSLIRNAGGYEIEALEPPSVARKVAPSAVLFLLAGAMLGSLLGLAMAYVAEARHGALEPASRMVSQALHSPAPNGNGAVAHS